VIDWTGPEGVDRPGFPDPPEGGTVISWALATRGQVELKIYDVSGRVVRLLVDERLAAGDHEIVWDGRDDAGRRLPAGHYYYELRMNSRVVGAQKAIVLE
jgi:flagellar hook assembly protein FlgD